MVKPSMDVNGGLPLGKFHIRASQHSPRLPLGNVEQKHPATQKTRSFVKKSQGVLHENHHCLSGKLLKSMIPWKFLIPSCHD